MGQYIKSFDDFINEGNKLFPRNLEEDKEYVYYDYSNDMGKREINVKYIGEVKKNPDIKLTFTRTYHIDLVKPNYIFQVLDADTNYYLTGKSMKDKYFAVTDNIVMRFITKK